MRSMRLTLAAAVVAIAALLASPPAAAISLEAARAQGVVGETLSGYLAPVQSPSAEVQDLIQSVNAKRRQHYQGIASRNGIPIEEVGRLTAEKIINGLPNGAYYQGNGGAWRQR